MMSCLLFRMIALIGVGTPWITFVSDFPGPGKTKRRSVSRVKNSPPGFGLIQSHHNKFMSPCQGLRIVESGLLTSSLGVAPERGSKYSIPIICSAAYPLTSILVVYNLNCLLWEEYTLFIRID